MPNITGVSSPVLGNDKNTYSTKIDDSLDAIDAHDHTTGKGVQVPTGGIADLAITPAKLAADSVTRTKILDGEVIEAKLATGAVTTAKIGALQVDTAQIAAGAVTQAKRVELGQQISSSSGAHIDSTGTDVDVTNMSISITTTGRPVMIMLVPDGTTDEAYIGQSSSTFPFASTLVAQFRLWRGATEIYRARFEQGADAAGVAYQSLPPGAICTLDTPSAGTYTYKLSATGAGGHWVLVRYCKLVAFEL